MNSDTLRERFEQAFAVDTPAERAAMLAVLDKLPVEPIITRPLDPAQIRVLAAYLGLLPRQALLALVLYYCRDCPPHRITALTGAAYPMGLIIYCRDRLTRCMELPHHAPAGDWRAACTLAVRRHPRPAGRGNSPEKPSPGC